ncbi:MAG: TPM domain-containing protein [Oscillospiraceae bacterium]|nr:TPM domain-containing protein [Oscillospiraceae bacterium]
MPHSSGGGSHSGGFHSGGHHSGGHSGSRAPRISRRPYINSRRFMYYDRYGRQQSIYSTAMPKKQSLLSLIITLLIMIPFILISSVMMYTAYKQTKDAGTLTPLSTFESTHISDGAGVIDNDTQLEKTLKNFESTTGICPYIITVSDSDWDQDYGYLEDYAYTLYLENFDDEQHFLIVYSEPDNVIFDNFADWSWEGIQGDDTDPIITEEHFSKFQRDLQKYLTKDDVSVTDAFNTAFSDSLVYMMSGDTDKINSYIMICMGVFWGMIMLSVVCSAVRSYLISCREYHEVPMDYSGEEEPYYGPEIK